MVWKNSVGFVMLTPNSRFFCVTVFFIILQYFRLIIFMATLFNYLGGLFSIQCLRWSHGDGGGDEGGFGLWWGGGEWWQAKRAGVPPCNLGFLELKQ